MEYLIDNEINNAIRDVAKLISNDEQQINQLVEKFKKKVTVQFAQHTIDGTSHAAGTDPIIDFKEDNGTFKVVCNKIVVTLPELSNTTNIHHFRIDARHEFFHAFAYLLNNNIIRLNVNSGKMFFNLGGKINERSMYNPRHDNNDSYASVLFNEIVTDLSAYCSYYPQLNISMNQILNGNGLESINDTYGMGNGYRQLFPLGMCIIKAFSNYRCDYDRLGQNKYEAKYPTDSDNVYYNDLLYGILYNPLTIKDSFIKYTTEEDWQTLENIAKNIVTDFKGKDRKVDYDNIQECLTILAKYLNNKYQKINDPIIKNQLAMIIPEFNEYYKKSLSYYSNLGYNRNTRSLM